MSRISDALNSVTDAFGSAAVAVKTKLGFMPAVEKTIKVAPVTVAQTVATVQARREEKPVAKTRFERFTNFVHNNRAASIGLLAAAIFAVVYGVDKYRQNKCMKELTENSMGVALLESEKELKANLYASSMRKEKTLGNLDQFPGAKAILQKAFEEDDRFAREISPGIGMEATEALTTELSEARDAELAIDAGLEAWATSYDEAATADEMFLNDDRFAPSIPLDGQGDIHGENGQGIIATYFAREAAAREQARQDAIRAGFGHKFNA